MRVEGIVALAAKALSRKIVPTAIGVVASCLGSPKAGTDIGQRIGQRMGLNDALVPVRLTGI